MVHEQDFRDLMAGVCAPVTVVTTASSGTPYGATVSAFASLSLRPAMVTVALDRGSRVLAEILAAGRFAVNVLAAEQADLALGFARRDTDRFAAVAWEWDAGLPRLAGTPNWLACTVEQAVEGGDHLLVLGAVDAVRTRDAAPLVYGYRTFGTHSAYAGLVDQAIHRHIRALARV